MGPVATTYAVLTVVMAAICALARLIAVDADRIARAAAWTAFFTGMSCAISSVLPVPWSYIHFPAQDVLMLALALGWYRVRAERWARLFAGLAFLHLVVHALFWSGAVSPWAYPRLNNGVFILDLLTLSVAGGGYVVRGFPDFVRQSRGGGARAHSFLEAAR